MPLTILTDSNVKEILDNLSKDELEGLQKAMRNSLHDYATSAESDAAQPQRTVIEAADGTTTLFMPSTNPSCIGMKVVTLPCPKSEPDTSLETPAIEVPEGEKTTPQGALTLMNSNGKPFAFVNAEEVTAFRTALASSLLMRRRTKIKTITVFGTGKQAFWHVRLALLLRGHTIKKIHFFNRDFNQRSTNLIKSFYQFDHETKIKEGWADCKFDLTGMKYGEVDRLLKDHVRSADMIICTTPSTAPLFDHKILTNSEGRKRARLIIAIGSYKPHMIEVPPEVLSQAVKIHGHSHHYQKRAEEGGVIVVDTLSCLRECGELVEAGIEAYQTVELGELVMLSQMKADESAIDDSPEDEESPRASLDVSSVATPTTPHSPVTPKSIALAFRNNASFVRSSSRSNSKPASRSASRAPSQGPSRKSSVSLSRKPSFSLKARSLSTSSQGGKKKKKQTEQQDQMSRWLSDGNVVYKSVGMGLMDLTVGSELVRIARRKGVGTTVKGF